MAETNAGDRWWTKDTVAVVTGSNKGIGFATAQQLAKHGLTVVLTARDHARGQAALEALKGEGLSEFVHFHPLDVTSSESVKNLAAWVKVTFGGFDILVNNAGVNLFSGTYDDGVTMLETNYYGPKKVINGLQHLLRVSPVGARIVNVTSTVGSLKYLQSTELKEELDEEVHLTEDLVDSFAAKYLQDLKTPGNCNSEGWPWATSLHSYRESKILLNAYSRVLARAFQDRIQLPNLDPNKNSLIFVNCACPGLTLTDLRLGILKLIQEKGLLDLSKGKTPEEGADTIVWLALLPRDRYPSGEFFADRKQVPF